MSNSIQKRLIAAALTLLYAFAGKAEPYRVKPGDSLYKIAKENEVTVTAVLNANPVLRKREKQAIHPGDLLVIPEPPVSGPAKVASNSARETGTGKRSTATYLVQSGDSLWEVANGAGLTVSQLLDINPELKAKKWRAIHPGMTLFLPGPPSTEPPPAAVANEGSSPSMPPPTPSDVTPSAPTVAGFPSGADLTADDASASRVRDGVTNGGWVVTYNPNISRDLLFIHESSSMGMLTNLLYYAQVGGDGKWTLYDARESSIIGKHVAGKPKAVMSKPSRVSMGQCTCR